MSKLTPHSHGDDHDGGLAVDLARLMQQRQGRRQALGWLLGLSAAGAVAACGGGGDATDTTSTGSTGSSGSPGSSGSGSSASCSVIPEETAGPYPGDGSNGPNALALASIVRSDIRASIDGATGVATGVPLTVVLELVNSADSCADLDGYAIYLWHCDAQGRYSMYSSGVTDENYLRGVQPTGTDGKATFVTVFPGCYSGRMPHMHFEIYRAATSATSWSNKLKTSQLAFPEDVCNTVYATSGYTNSASNFARISFATDNVFSDGVSLQLATVTGDATNGYTATLTVAISA